jgi:hypothetical protein
MRTAETDILVETEGQALLRLDRLLSCVREAQRLIGPTGDCDADKAETVSARFGLDAETGSPVLSVAEVLAVARAIRRRRSSHRSLVSISAISP